jgi:ABC-type nickel/cobalt efflux system permease component RcnA
LAKPGRHQDDHDVDDDADDHHNHEEEEEEEDDDDDDDHKTHSLTHDDDVRRFTGTSKRPSKTFLKLGGIWPPSG